MTPALSRWHGVESQPGVERLLAVCRDVFGDAKCETLKRLRDRLSIHLDCEPAVVSAMSLEEFLSAWKGDAKLHGKHDKPDLKHDKPERKRRRRPMNAEAADCARLFKKAKRTDPTTKMTHIVAEYADKLQWFRRVDHADTERQPRPVEDRKPTQRRPKHHTVKIISFDTEIN